MSFLYNLLKPKESNEIITIVLELLLFRQFSVEEVD